MGNLYKRTYKKLLENNKKLISNLFYVTRIIILPLILMLILKLQWTLILILIFFLVTYIQKKIEKVANLDQYNKYILTFLFVYIFFLILAFLSAFFFTIPYSTLIKLY